MRIDAFSSSFGISYRDHVIINEMVKTRIVNVMGPHEDLLALEKDVTEEAWVSHMITSSYHPTGNSAWRETKRKTDEAMGRQHPKVDWS